MEKKEKNLFNCTMLVGIIFCFTDKEQTIERLGLEYSEISISQTVQLKAEQVDTVHRTHI